MLPPHTIERAATAHPIYDARRPIDPELGVTTYGQGQVISTYRGHRVVYHLGNLSGNHSVVMRLPDHDIGVAVMANGGYEAGAYETRGVRFQVAWRVLDDLLNLEPVDWKARLVNELRAQPAPALPPAHPTAPTVSPSSVEGTYRCPGYLPLEITPYDPAVPEHQVWTADLPRTVRPAHPGRAYIATMTGSLILPVFVLTHYDGDVFSYITPRKTVSRDAHHAEQYVPHAVGPGRAAVMRGKIGFGSNWVQVFPAYKYQGDEKAITGKPGDETGVDVWFVRNGATGEADTAVENEAERAASAEEGTNTVASEAA